MKEMLHEQHFCFHLPYI